MTVTEPSAARQEIARISIAPRLLVALDFDGTLSPLVDDPMSARMTEGARSALTALAALPSTTVALVSGRSLVDLRVIAEHDDDSALLLAGSHGAEFWLPGEGRREHEDAPDAAALRDTLRARAEDLTAGIDGVWIEPKTFGFGIHTRMVSAVDAERAHHLVDELVSAEAPTWRRRAGHNIVEYAFRHEGKDSAIAELRALTDADAVVFAGDDVTDEDALASLGPTDLGVRVGDAPTAARVIVPDIDGMVALLVGLADERGAQRE